MTLHRSLSTEEREEIERYEQQEATARQQRQSVARFRATFSLTALGDKLPLRFPTQSAVAAPSHFRALSWYTYPGWTPLTHLKRLAVMSPFFIALHLIDFSPLRAELLALTAITVNGPGQTPFDPVSLFLCCLLRLEKGLGWAALAKFLAGPEGECWCRLFGFRDHTPSASTMRTFQSDLGVGFDTDLCPRFMQLLCDAGLLPDASASSPAPGLPLTADGMLHASHASMRCGKATHTCYQPTSAQSPRPCPAREAGQEGCTCSQDDCVQACRLVTPRDPEVRLIHYSGSNQGDEQEPARARDVYGYRSYPQLICDDDLHLSWVAYTSVHPANSDERTIFPSDFAHLHQRLPHISIGEVIADAAVGYKHCLDAVYELGAVPVIAIRRDATDRDPQTCKWRGYDQQGHPLCAHGYPMAFNGIDYHRLRACWTCRQLCARLTDPHPEDAGCPFRDPAHPLGQVRHVNRAFAHPDGTRHYRLARLYPYGSDLWQAHYASRKNRVEGRNAQITRLGLKRVWSYGLAGATADITFADLLINLRTLGRLVQEATWPVA
jgi:hypothetical protein